MKLALISLLLFINVSQAQSDFGSIEITISTTTSDEGVVQVLIFDQEKGWPESLDNAWKIVTLPIEKGSARKTFINVPTGNYAITVFHDHDEDGLIRKNKIGYPIDSFGFSKNPSLFFGIPPFSKCSQKVNAGKSTIFRIELR